MRHHSNVRKFGRENDQRVALIRSLAVALILEEKIKTTEARAKEIRPFVEKLITKARTATLASRKAVLSTLGGDTAVAKLCDEIAPKFKDRKGGYTRITKLPARAGDASPMAVIEFVA